jgi:hypothetical protein
MLQALERCVHAVSTVTKQYKRVVNWVHKFAMTAAGQFGNASTH